MTEEMFSFTPDENGELTLQAAVFQAIGAASTCWENLEEAGVFDTDRAAYITGCLLSLIEQTVEQYVEMRVSAATRMTSSGLHLL